MEIFLPDRHGAGRPHFVQAADGDCPPWVGVLLQQELGLHLATVAIFELIIY